MKFTLVGFSASLIAVVSAQVANNTAPSSATTVAPTTVASNPVPTTNAISSCAVQAIFELCLKNEDNYVNTCQDKDYACLCRWHKEKLSCWNNCPNDENYGKQEAIVNSFCSMPGANISIARWTSTMPATSTPIAPVTVLPTSVPATPTTTANKSSSAAIITISQGALTLAGIAAAYMLF